MAPRTVVAVIDGKPGDTTRVVSTDAAQNLPAGVITVTSKKSRFLLITCEGANIRFTAGAGATPTSGASGTGHILYAGQHIEISHKLAISTFQYISAIAGVPGVLQITPET